MSKIIWTADIRLKPGRKAEFLQLVRRHGARCLELEDGCLRFEILEPKDDEYRVILSEVYADKAAFDDHFSTDRIAAFRQATADLIESRAAFASDLHSLVV